MNDHEQVRLLIAMSDQEQREHLMAALRKLKHIQVVAEAHTPLAAVRSVEDSRPDVLLLGDLPGVPLEYLLQSIKRLPASPFIIVLVTSRSPALRRRLWESGADEIVLASNTSRLPKDVLRALQHLVLPSWTVHLN